MNVGGTITLTATFEAGEAGDEHALYVAYDTEDRGDSISDWAALQRGCNVAADATSATIPVSPLLTAGGRTICRVFLTTSSAPYDTLIESLRQTGTQYLDTGMRPDSNTVIVIDARVDSQYPRQQRFGGVSSNDGTALFPFDVYVNNSGTISTACQSGGGNWKGTDVSPLERLQIYLSAPEKHRVVLTRDGSELVDTSYNTTCTNTSAATFPIFAHYLHTGGKMAVQHLAQGADLYGFTMTNDGVCVCNYLPCTRGGRAGVYDTVTETFRWSASGEDFVVGGGAIACSLLDGETQLAAAPSALDVSVQPDPSVGAVWKGAASGVWNFSDANWTVDGATGQVWSNGKIAIFNDNASSTSVNIPSGVTVTPESMVFDATSDYTLSGSGAIAGTGTFQKLQGGKLTISGVNHSFTGDVLLAGGETVLTSDKDSSDITSGSLGNPRAERSIVVSNATLRVLGQNPFGGGGRSTTPIKTAIRLNNSTLELTTNFCFNAGDVYLHNSGINFHGGLNLYGKTWEGGDPYSRSFWGSLSVANLYFSGNRQVVLTGSGGNAFSGMSISKFAKQGVIDVPDMTGNDDVDVSIRMPIIWSSGNTSGDPGIASGFRKTGPGTLRLNCSNDEGKYYTEATRVNEGALLVDSAAFKSTNIIVQTGAYVGGTGTVQRVTIEQGGGFTAAPGQARALTLQAAKLPADGVVTLDVPYTGDVERLESVRVPVVTASALAGATWRVMLNGAAVPHGYVGSVDIRDGVVYGVVGRGGTCVIFR